MSELNPLSEKIITEEDLKQALLSVPNPAGEGSLWSAGKVRFFEIQGSLIRLEVEGQNPALHARQKLERQIKDAIAQKLGDRPHSVEVTVYVPPAIGNSKENILPGVKHVVAVASGKGGVGKSTVAVNLAVALRTEGFAVGLVDGDIYGPSVPVMFDVEYRRPEVRRFGEKPFIIPVENYGVLMMSIGFFAGVNQAVAWRGPMASKALRQMFVDCWWGNLDFMIVDLPPGTGDIHLTLVQMLPLTGAIIVTTPQKVALLDARKAAAMFRMPAIQVPILGVVENMAWFSPSAHPEERYYLFGKGGGEELAAELNVPLLAQIPLDESLCEQSDKGMPITLNTQSPLGKIYKSLAQNLLSSINTLLPSSSN
ncbi:MAG: Mrp/NBP35 family ATP-binding protein [Flavobacteriales bacterium]|nr:Mrp/NBP35 family ATP-binding protein [Flavobacteriales bacterium]MCX7768413.1 Mrp/NBP35 family ATP-binding protein [Flavobacteriales bacterium]MDW8409694.1 Mrp/NBP35 family ATP-binding protein [Flavobacteriales bacterium]